jgi:hypothetical protein
MAQGGDSRAGYTTTVDLSRGLLHSRCWGFWEMHIASDWKADALAAVHLVRSPSFSVLADLDQFVPQRPSVQEEVRAFAVAIAALKPRGAVFLVSNAITKLQLVRLLREEKCSIWSFQSNEGAALAWLEKSSSGGSHVRR